MLVAQHVIYRYFFGMHFVSMKQLLIKYLPQGKCRQWRVLCDE